VLSLHVTIEEELYVSVDYNMIRDPAPQMKGRTIGKSYVKGKALWTHTSLAHAFTNQQHLRDDGPVTWGTTGNHEEKHWHFLGEAMSETTNNQHKCSATPRSIRTITVYRSNKMITTLKALVVCGGTVLLLTSSVAPVNAAPRAALLRVGATVSGLSSASAADTTLAPSAATEGSDDQRVLWNEDFLM
jgi:hypothetical protein